MNNLNEGILKLSPYTLQTSKLKLFDEISVILSSIYTTFKKVNINSIIENDTQVIVHNTNSNSNTENNIESIRKNNRENNRKREDERVAFLCKSINDRTVLGEQLRTKYNENFGKQISSVLKVNTNQQHYDMLIIHEDGSKIRCEEKGTAKKHTIESLQSDHPWQNSVQRFNGPGNKFDIGAKYANLWYKTVLAEHGEEIRKMYDIHKPIPSLDEWLKYDAFACSDPTSDFGKELKTKYRDRHPGCSMNGRGESPKDYRILVNPKFIESFNNSDKALLINQTQIILDEIMLEKDCWLKTSGTIEDGITFSWFDKIKPPKIIALELSWNPGADIYIEFKTENKKDDFKSILRFGKGTGFSNIRFDMR